MGLEVEGAKFVIANMEKFKALAEAEIKQAIRLTALDVQRAEKKYLTMKTKRGTGKLASSIIVENLSDGLTSFVQPLADYAPYIEYGTRPHTIRARNKKVLAAKVVGARAKGKGQYTYFGKEAQHPGTYARPFVEPAAAFGEKQLEQRLTAALEKAMPKQ